MDQTQNGAEVDFDRWRPPHGGTIAYRMFRSDIVEVNTFCWNAQGAINHAQATLSQAISDDSINKFLNYGKDLGRRSDTLVSDASKQFKDVDNWVRLSTVVCIASLFELFVRRIVRLALRSDPGLLISTPGAVDGVVLLKSNNGKDVSEQVRSCSEGLWSTREEGLKRVFGVRIDAVFDNLKTLQAIQSLRNSVAHDFARTAKAKDFWYIDPTQAAPQAITRVSAERLQNMLRVVSAVATEIEKCAKDHVGSFELFDFWHSFLSAPDRSEVGAMGIYSKLYREGVSAKLISTYYHRMTNRTLKREYCRSLLNYYRSI